MSGYLQISIPDSCAESWKHNAGSTGNYCNSCCKTVIDFASITAGELVNFFEKKKKNVCGRVTIKQLEKEILIPQKKINWVKYFMHFTILHFYCQ